jgi:hypothetical protein
MAAATPELTPVRAAALLEGRVPCFHPSLSRAYGNAVATLSRAVSVNAHEELRNEEVVSLLSSKESPLRVLALHTVRNLLAVAESDAGAGAALLEVVAAGALPLVFRAAWEAATTLESVSDDAAPAALAEVSLCAAIATAAVFKGGAALLGSDLGVASEQAFRHLAGAGAAMMRDAMHESDMGTAVAAAEMDASAQLLLAWYSLRKRSGALGALSDACFENELCEKGFVAGCCAAILKFPNTPVANAAIRAVYTGMNDAPFCELMRATDGFSVVLNAISSTMVESEYLALLLAAVSNAATAGDQYAVLFTEKGVFKAIQPALFSDKEAVVLSAAFSIATLAIIPDLAETLGESDVLDVCASVLRTMIPGGVQLLAMIYAEDVKMLAKMLASDSPNAVQLTGLHQFCALLHNPMNVPQLSTQGVVALLRQCAASPDAFIYTAAITALRRLNLAFPSYRSKDTSAQSGRGGTIDTWSIDAVCEWVGDQTFSTYRPLFRNGFVSGKVLVSLTVDDLCDLGVTHKIHQRAIRFAIDELCATFVGGSGGGGGGGGGGSGGGGGAAPLLKTRASPQFDVFLSYRRLGGADFAQLLKVELQALGLRVFLDIDNLGTGKFDDALQHSLGCSKNIVLVWTKGCMDRFFTPLKASEMDFVREEYKLALALGKNIIPLYKEVRYHPPAIFRKLANLPYLPFPFNAATGLCVPQRGGHAC